MKTRLFELIIGLGIVVLVVCIWGDVRELNRDLVLKALETLLIALLFLLIAAIKRRRELLFVFRLHQKLEGPSGEIDFALLRNELKHFRGELNDLASSKGLTLRTERLDRFVGAFFDVNKDRQYVGVGRTLPSEFEIYYPTYVTQQLAYPKNADEVPDYRIIIASRDRIEADFLNNRGSAELFFQKHADSPGMILLLADEGTLNKFPLLAQLRTLDVGVWNFGVACWFNKPEGSSGKHEVSIETTRDVRPLLTEYFERLNECSIRMDLQGDALRFSERAHYEVEADRQNLLQVLL